MAAENYPYFLDKVSRSFAFCIEELESPLKEWVGLSYLICRIIDTVEDAQWNSPADQEKSFAVLKGFLQKSPLQADVDVWAALVPQGIPEVERELLGAAFELISDYHALPTAAQGAVSSPVMSMINGMVFFRHQAQGSKLKLNNLSDINRYCFFVAGVVGELLSQLFSQVSQQKNDLPFTLKGVGFGLYLQKVNILKDQAADKKEGREFITSETELIENLQHDGRVALDYLLSLPERHFGYKTFCAWSFFLGLLTIETIYQNLDTQPEDREKISREDTWNILGEVQLNIHDNVALKKLTKKFSWFNETGKTSAKWISPKSSMLNLYTGDLSDQDLKSVGVFLT